MGKAKSTNNKANRGRRFTPEQRAHALTLVRAQMKRTEIARVIGTTPESIRRWINAAAQDGAVAGGEPTHGNEAADVAATKAATSAAKSPYKPKDPGQGLAAYEVEAIVELKREHPSYGPAQLRAQLKRFKGWRLSNKAIARVLKQHGYELVHVKGRPQGPEPIRFEAPRRNALWQMDFATMRVGGDKLQMLVIIDDFSRYVVGHTLGDDSDGNVVIKVLELAIARHGKPEGVRTDRGGMFTGGQVGKWLEVELIDHSVGRSYHPQVRRVRDMTEGRGAHRHGSPGAVGRRALRRSSAGTAPARRVYRAVQPTPRPHGHRRSDAGRPLLRSRRPRARAHRRALTQATRRTPTGLNKRRPDRGGHLTRCGQPHGGAAADHHRRSDGGASVRCPRRPRAGSKSIAS